MICISCFGGYFLCVVNLLFPFLCGPLPIYKDFKSFFFSIFSIHTCTADFKKRVLSVYTHSMKTIYRSLSAQVARSTFFMKSPVSSSIIWKKKNLYHIITIGDKDILVISTRNVEIINSIAMETSLQPGENLLLGSVKIENF